MKILNGKNLEYWLPGITMSWDKQCSCGHRRGEIALQVCLPQSTTNKNSEKKNTKNVLSKYNPVAG